MEKSNLDFIYDFSPIFKNEYVKNEFNQYIKEYDLTITNKSKSILTLSSQKDDIDLKVNIEDDKIIIVRENKTKIENTTITDKKITSEIINKTPNGIICTALEKHISSSDDLKRPYMLTYLYEVNYAFNNSTLRRYLGFDFYDKNLEQILMDMNLLNSFVKMDSICDYSSNFLSFMQQGQLTVILDDKNISKLFKRIKSFDILHNLYKLYKNQTNKIFVTQNNDSKIYQKQLYSY